MIKFFQAAIVEPSKPHQFWCSDCDMKKVDSQDKATGSFFMFRGEKYSGPGHWDGGDTSILFALCAYCLRR